MASAGPDSETATVTYRGLGCVLERKWQPTPVLLPGKSHGRRSLVGYSPWGCKESGMTEQLHFASVQDVCVAG